MLHKTSLSSPHRVCGRGGTGKGNKGSGSVRLRAAKAAAAPLLQGKSNFPGTLF